MTVSKLSHRRVILAAALILAGFSGTARADVKADVLAAHQAMVAFGKFRAVGVTESKGHTQHSVTEVVWPDRYHMKTDQMELIILPGKTFMNQGGKWTPFPMDMSQVIKQFQPDAMRQGYDSMSNTRDLGTELLDGKSARVYEYDSSGVFMGIKAQSHAKIWVDADTHLVLKQESDGEAMGTKSHTEQTYEYDANLSVNAPN